ncbi:MAG TPA: c-type cytochrome [Pyrinomonadaceae bacterium]|nr:c-type cytochrome [Pyrinomonadaceae bacterium]
MSHQIVAHLTRSRLLVFFAVLLFVAGVSVVSSVERGLAQGPAQGAAPQAAPAEKTVEQVQKNIQVLNGLPASQLIPVMNYMGSSLGVKCTFCHVNKDGKWDFVSDDKPEKGSAREMIKMVQGLNKASFKGNPAVGCFTCHRGSEHPARVPNLPIAMPTPFAETELATTATKETPPTADQILAKYVEALGGSAAIEKIKTRTMKGSLLVSNGATWSYEAYQTAPDKLYMVLNTPKMGVIQRGFDGQMGWELTQGGFHELHNQALFNLRRYTDLYKDLKLQGQFTRISYGGKEKLDGKDVYVLRGLGVDGKGERLYFDVQSGLLVRRVSSTPTMVGVIPEQVDFSDYRSVDGLKLPFVTTVTSIDSFFNSTRTLTEIKLNVPVDETKFKAPPPPPPMPTPSPKP